MVEAQFSGCRPIALRVYPGNKLAATSNPFIDWFKYEVTLPSGFVVAAVPVTTSHQVELCTLKGLFHTLRANKPCW